MCLWGFFPIVFPLKWSLKIHWGFRSIYNSVSRFLLLWDLLLCVFYSKSISSINRCSCLIFHGGAPIQPDIPNQTFWECIPCSNFLPSVPAGQCHSLFSFTPQSDPLCWSREQNRKWAMTPSPSTWVPLLTHGVMLTSAVTCLTWGSPTWREKGISAVPNQLSASLVTPASSVNQLKRKWYQAQPVHWNDCRRRNYYPVITLIIFFYPFSFFFPHKAQHHFYPEYAMEREERSRRGRRLLSSWQAEAHTRWSFGIFWPKMDSCKHMAKAHKCISRKDMGIPLRRY